MMDMYHATGVSEVALTFSATNTPVAMRSVAVPSFLALFTSTPVIAQNLVPNPGFEEYTTCPDNAAEIIRAVGWEVHHPSPDYFNACSSQSSVGTPLNFVGYQTPAEGQAYAGLATYFEPGSVPNPENSKEIMGIQLLTPLTPNVPVYISLKVSPTADGYSESMRWSSQGIGLRFSTSLSLDLANSLPNNAAVHMAVVPTDTTGWVIISGVYVPDSAYEYALIGNFFSDSLLTPILINPNGNTGYAYMYVDQVCVSYNPNECDMSNSIMKLNDIYMVAYPNPFENDITIKLFGKVVEGDVVQLFDSQGRCRRQWILSAGEHEIRINGEPLENGLYTIKENGIGNACIPVTIIRASP